MHFAVDNQSILCQDGESVLVALLRAGLHPTGGGCLCLAGDCPHCLVSVDGVAYVRSCQVAARAGLVVERSHLSGQTPPLLTGKASETSVAGAAPAAAPARNLHCDAVVIGQGSAGLEAAAELRHRGLEVVVLDSGNLDSGYRDPGNRDPGNGVAPVMDASDLAARSDRQDVIGIYPGPLVVARADHEMLHVHARREIVVATGASEIQPAVPGNELAGLVTARAARALARAGIDLGWVVAVGAPPQGVDAKHLPGELVRFEGSGKVEAVVVRGLDGSVQRVACDTVSLGLGFQPRDALYRMARDIGSLGGTPSDQPVRLVGDAARPSDIPPCPRDGVVCPCSGVTVQDLEQVWQRGFHELELVKRATLAGTGTCQGAVCIPHIRSFLEEHGRELQPPFTARPVSRQLTIGEVAAGAYHQATPRTALYHEHLRLGARMERSSGWWRPWHYGDPQAEYRAARESVSLGDVGTLGKLVVSGPDALQLLEHLYPTRVSTIRPGRSRYALLLDERGYVLDDGLVARVSNDRFLLTLTSGGATFAELWFRDWADSLRNARGEPLDVRVLNQTMSQGAINVTGPMAAELLARAGAERLPKFAGHLAGVVAGVECRIFRLSFTGELSYELHHTASDSVVLWRRLLELGRDLGIGAHGVDTLLDLRLEKGHLVVGKDTDYDSTPRRLGHQWAVDPGKPAFVGRQALLRTDKVPLDRQLVGFEMESPAPIDGAVVRFADTGDYAGYLTSSFDSPSLGAAVMLGWLELRDGELVDTVEIDGRVARRVPTPFYDRDNARSRTKVSVSLGRNVGHWTGGGASSGVLGEASVQAQFRLFRTVEATRIIARPQALDRLSVKEPLLHLRIAADEVLIVPRDFDLDRVPSRSAPVSEIDDVSGVDDPHAIVTRDTGFAGVWLDVQPAEAFLERSCAWELPSERPAFAQGAVADLPVKLWLEAERVLVLVPAPLAHLLEERML